LFFFSAAVDIGGVAADIGEFRHGGKLSGQTKIIPPIY
jgi:hypothetical protein